MRMHAFIAQSSELQLHRRADSIMCTRFLRCDSREAAMVRAMLRLLALAAMFALAPTLALAQQSKDEHKGPPSHPSGGPPKLPPPPHPAFKPAFKPAPGP